MSKQPSEKPDDNQFDIQELSYKTSHTAVRKARRFALQGLYEWLMTDRRFEQTGQGEWQANAPHDIAARTRANNAMHTVHLGYYHEMMREIPTQIAELETLITAHLDRDISKIDRVEHAVLLIGAYELKHSLHIPYKVVLDEAMKLNTHFGATDAHKLINAVMDKLAAELRTTEVASSKASQKTNGTKSESKSKPVSKMSQGTANEDTKIEEVATDNNESVKVESTENVSDTQTQKVRPRIGRKKQQSNVPKATSLESASKVQSETKAQNTEHIGNDTEKTPSAILNNANND